MIVRLLLVVVFLIFAGASAYMTWLTWRTNDDGKWLFIVFFVFFLLLAASPILPKFRSKLEPELVNTSTRFAPHWFMLLATLVLLGAIIVALVGLLGAFPGGG